ncbi:hypothetical protein LTR37_002394 [Vermiconidia calcicola]|uniref:Uncharacterized protein n=1 Tax=Vermiconidia calcicola TaxID=1690605 RepID=A0ACC3NSK5_9PEZI|nr:hypothetical protein LTR37_002394 [Vermiconidia calcicola]
MGGYVYKDFKSKNEIRVLTLLGRNTVNRTAGNGVYCELHHRSLPPKAKPTRPSQNLSSCHEDPQHVELKEQMQYEAVSWTWGGEEAKESIFIKVGNGWKTIEVRSNLIKVLEHLRNAETPRQLWVDAVCINQKDDAEKNLQVAMMAEIYGNASNVCIWLGEHKDESLRALGFIAKSVSDLGMFEEITTATFSAEWKALAALMNRPWFSRRWVVQEISHAKDATVHCGDDKVKWSDFETAVSLFERDAVRISKIFHGSETAEYDREFFGEVPAMGATRLVQAKSKLFRRDDENSIVEYRLHLSDLVTELSHFEANNPHDMIYAVLSLAKDTHSKTVPKSHLNEDNINVEAPEEIAQANGTKRSFDTAQSLWIPDGQATVGANDLDEPRSKRLHTDQSRDEVTSDLRKKALATNAMYKLHKKAKEAKFKHRVFQVDYKQDFFDVCKQFLDFTLQNAPGHNNLDILCRPWAPKEKVKRPSWIPKAADAPFEMRPARYAPGGQQVSRKNHDPLVCQSYSGSSSVSSYNACRSLRARDWRFGDFKDEDQTQSLFVKGFILDQIGVIETYSQLGNVPPEWFELAEWYPWDHNGRRSPDSHPPERLWRTLVADRGPKGASAEVYYSKAFEYAIDNSTPHSGVETTVLAQRSNPILVEFLKRMMAVIWNRKLFKSAVHEQLGLAPKKARQGDSICILHGCSVPVVLRQHISLSGTKHYEFVGECYLHTMMDGKAVDIQEDNESSKTVEFELR